MLPQNQRKPFVPSFTDIADLKILITINIVFLCISTGKNKLLQPK